MTPRLIAGPQAEAIFSTLQDPEVIGPKVLADLLLPMRRGEARG